MVTGLASIPEGTYGNETFVRSQEELRLWRRWSLKDGDLVVPDSPSADLGQR